MRSRAVLLPLAKDGLKASARWATPPLAILSKKPRLLYDYFKQLFAQVTNPPIDCIREEIITSAETRLGSEDKLLQHGATACRRVQSLVV